MGFALLAKVRYQSAKLGAFVMTSLLEKVRILREEAWGELIVAPEYTTFKALDEAVVRMGGVSKLPLEASAASEAVRQIIDRTIGKATAEGGKRKYSDAAEIALRMGGAPLTISRLMEAAEEHGAEVGGTDPLNNFRSAVSKDPRFLPLRREGKHFWWLAGEPVPPSKNEAATPDWIEEAAASSLRSSEEGGDGHGPATT